MADCASAAKEVNRVRGESDKEEEKAKEDANCLILWKCASSACPRRGRYTAIVRDVRACARAASWRVRPRSSAVTASTGYRWSSCVREPVAATVRRRSAKDEGELVVQVQVSQSRPANGCRLRLRSAFSTREPHSWPLLWSPKQVWEQI